MRKRIFRFELKLSSYWQSIDFSRNSQISHVQKNCNFLKYNWNCLDQLPLPYNFHGSSMRGILFFIVASCEWLNNCKSRWSKMWCIWGNPSFLPSPILLCHDISIVYFLPYDYISAKKKKQNKTKQKKTKKKHCGGEL